MVEELAPLILSDADDPRALRFDALMYGIELAFLAGKPYSRARKDLLQKVRGIAGVVNILEIQAQSELIDKLLHTNYLDDAGIHEFEYIRECLRGLIKYIPIDWARYDTNFDDEILSMEWREAELENDDLKNYKAKAEFYVRQHQDEAVIAKLRGNIPLDAGDVDALESASSGARWVHDRNMRTNVARSRWGSSSGNLPQAGSRAVQVTKALQERFAPSGNAALFSGPGRTEIGGNHTDHQHGHVLCGSVNLDMLACAAPNDLRMVRIQSEGYPALEIDLDDLEPKKEEENTSAALVRGVAAKIKKLGYELSGFDACANSTVLSGSGLSSSAAYETLVGTIFNHFCCEDQLDPITIAKIGQYAENVYFGKPCGLMDQMGSSVGGVVAIDFADPAAPTVEKVDFDFSRSGHVLCIVDTRSSHDDLTDDYAGITREMGAVAAYFGKTVLRDVPEADFRAALPALRKACGDRAVLRALHFYDDDRRAVQAAQALKRGDFARFLTLVNESGMSSALHLQNIWSVSSPNQQAVSVALAVGAELLNGMGAIRVHGGGFAGTIQAFVPNDRLNRFKAGMEALLGEGTCHILHIRPQGGCVVAE